MGARLGVVIGVLAAATGVAHAQQATLEPTKLSVFVPSGWQVMRERGTDFLHWETADDGGRSFDLSFERVTSKCKDWKAEAGTVKEFPAYWPKTARTHLYTLRGDGKVRSSGCLADVVGGSLLAHLEITVEDPKYKPSTDDVTVLGAALNAALSGSATLRAVDAKSAPPTTTVSDASGPPGTGQAPIRTVANIGGSATKGGTTVTVPIVDIAVRLPKAASWYVGIRGEAAIARAESVLPTLKATLFPLNARTCAEWRVDMATTEVATYEAKPVYLPASVKGGVFTWTTGTGTAFATLTASTCVATKVGTLGISIEYGGILEGDDATLVRQLIEGIAVPAAKHKDAIVSPPTLLDGGATADATIGSIKLPTGAQWRVTNGSIERFDKGTYFTLASQSRPSACAASSAAKEQPYLPAGLKATVKTRAGGATVVQVCVQTTHTIQLTLAYNGAIAAKDHALIKALFEAFVAQGKKASTKT